MGLKKSSGNMYPWVTHMHTHLGGECLHRCSYCYVDNPRFGRPKRYQGELRLIEDEFKSRYGEGKTIFIEHQNDLFAEGVDQYFINRVLNHCDEWPKNTYVFQTKNPKRYLNNILPENSILGCTIETNYAIPEDISLAPHPRKRFLHMAVIEARKFITIEPILDFNVETLSEWIYEINPEFVNIGADSKGHKLPEPSFNNVQALIDNIKSFGIEIREKSNLDRLRHK